VPTFDWEKKRWISHKELKELTRMLSARGVRYLAYYPDTMFNDRMSLQQ
jgi:hypothetical protein